MLDNSELSVGVLELRGRLVKVFPLDHVLVAASKFVMALLTFVKLAACVDVVASGVVGDCEKMFT